MNRHALRLQLLIVAIGLMIVSVPGRSLAQLSPADEERLKILTDPEASRRRSRRTRPGPPLEFFRSQVAPFDVLPLREGEPLEHLTLELRANYDDYDGLLQTRPVPARGHAAGDVYPPRRPAGEGAADAAGHAGDAPRVPKEMDSTSSWSGPRRSASTSSGRPPGSLEPHQMLVVVLTKDSTTQFAAWNRLPAFVPVDHGATRTTPDASSASAITGSSCRSSPTSRRSRRTR